MTFNANITRGKPQPLTCTGIKKTTTPEEGGTITYESSYTTDKKKTHTIGAMGLMSTPEDSICIIEKKLTCTLDTLNNQDAKKLNMLNYIIDQANIDKETDSLINSIKTDYLNLVKDEHKASILEKINNHKSKASTMVQKDLERDISNIKDADILGGLYTFFTTKETSSNVQKTVYISSNDDNIKNMFLKLTAEDQEKCKKHIDSKLISTLENDIKKLELNKKLKLIDDIVEGNFGESSDSLTRQIKNTFLKLTAEDQEKCKKYIDSELISTLENDIEKLDPAQRLKLLNDIVAGNFGESSDSFTRQIKNIFPRLNAEDQEKFKKCISSKLISTLENDIEKLDPAQRLKLLNDIHKKPGIEQSGVGGIAEINETFLKLATKVQEELKILIRSELKNTWNNMSELDLGQRLNLLTSILNDVNEQTIANNETEGTLSGIKDYWLTLNSNTKLSENSRKFIQNELIVEFKNNIAQLPLDEKLNALHYIENEPNGVGIIFFTVKQIERFLSKLDVSQQEDLKTFIKKEASTSLQRSGRHIGENSVEKAFNSGEPLLIKSFCIEPKDFNLDTIKKDSLAIAKQSESGGVKTLFILARAVAPNAEPLDLTQLAKEDLEKFKSILNIYSSLQSNESQKVDKSLKILEKIDECRRNKTHDISKAEINTLVETLRWPIITRQVENGMGNKHRYNYSAAIISRDSKELYYTMKGELKLAIVLDESKINIQNAFIGIANTGNKIFPPHFKTKPNRFNKYYTSSKYPEKMTKPDGSLRQTNSEAINAVTRHYSKRGEEIQSEVLYNPKNPDSLDYIKGLIIDLSCEEYNDISEAKAFLETKKDELKNMKEVSNKEKIPLFVIYKEPDKESKEKPYKLTCRSLDSIYPELFTA